MRTGVDNIFDHGRGGAGRGGAFTLIELLVVIAIIVVLAALSVPAVRALTQSSSRGQALNQVRAYVAEARAIATAQHRSAGVVFFEESAKYADPAQPGRTAMQIFVEDFDQAKYNPIEGTTIFIKYSAQREYLPAGIKLAVLNDDPNRGVKTGDEVASASLGVTRAIVFDATGTMITRHGLARPNLSGSPGTYPEAYGDWHFTTARDTHQNVGFSSPGIFLYDQNEYAAQQIPNDDAATSNAARNLWVKTHADVVIVNAYTGSLLR